MVDNNVFRLLLEEFKKENKCRARSIEAHMKEAKRVIELGLQSSMNVRHTSITARAKNGNNTIKTLERRQKERRQLKELKEDVQTRGESWEQYCKQWRMTDKVNEVKPFQDTDVMFKAMHDLAGIRISLYFPNDVEKVVEFLQRTFVIVEKPSRKGRLTRDFQKVRKFVEQQRQRGLDSEEDISCVNESTSRGFRATHLVVRHINLDFDPHAKDDPEVNIEIQIGTIVMHAWSDIEHEILYKPSGAEEPTEDVVSTLDLINSIVTLGEEALRQLESVSSRQATRQAEDRTKKAFNYHHMVPWLDKYFMDRETLLPPKHEWRSMPHLFGILEATSEHTYGRVEELPDDMNPKPEDMGELPALMLQHLGKDTYPFKNPENLGQPHLATTWNSRYWATCLVNTLNLATYMNESAAMYSAMLAESCRDQSLHDRRPTLAEFLDILHPSKAMHRPSRESEMIQFCMRLLEVDCEAPTPPKKKKYSITSFVYKPDTSLSRFN
ncbi:hypothetical protein CH35J_001025 [Colletotrichum higginsianum]|uniref:RelA/SpoT domain-containing protein n=1 Tax=Colletotrichum higginsianum TaxID=80884 RepID=A0A4T0WII9_9PEZI|nr:hypothetical protein CH35J_001025 [Colletotrichum higginsianum]